MATTTTNPALKSGTRYADLKRRLLFLVGALLALNGVGALDVSIAPGSTLLAHIVLLPLALLLLAFAWPRMSRVAGAA